MPQPLFASSVNSKPGQPSRDAHAAAHSSMPATWREGRGAEGRAATERVRRAEIAHLARDAPEGPYGTGRALRSCSVADGRSLHS